MEAPQVEAMSTETRNNNPPQDDEQDNIIDTWLLFMHLRVHRDRLRLFVLWPLLDFIIITSPGASCYIHPFFLILFLCYFFYYLALIC
ncbi:hypothetical protein HanXRQr2_Chr14g0651561 [Helianthus annuus]|uniref:Uncharacterized protein n=1 Tax=Helianthus annuus TaxID=4232 RepID=A0A9K3EAT1_HELAN|nr:hypothetical protein HanXRQr2_Chr14g0651561 [Helianthus annuus]